MDRETKTITTPGGHLVVLNAYLTGRESNALKELLFSSVKLSAEGVKAGEISVGNISGTVVLEQEQKSIELVVVAIDGEVATRLEKVLDLPEPEYAFVVEEINKIRNPFQKEK